MALAQLKAPDWRWQEARAYVAAHDAKHRIPLPSDTLVHFLIRLIIADRDPASRVFVTQKLPKLMAVYKLGSQDGQAPMRCQLQLSILAMPQDQQVMKHVPWIQPVQLRFYKNAFFDIEGKRDNRTWIQQYIMEPVRRKGTIRLFLARQLAYNEGYRAASPAILWGKTTAESRKAIHEMFLAQRMKNMFYYLAAQANLPAQLRATLMQTAIAKTQDRQFALKMKEQGKTNDSTIMQLAKGIQNSIRTYTIQQSNRRKQIKQDDTNDIIAQLAAQNSAAGKETVDELAEGK